MVAKKNIYKKHQDYHKIVLVLSNGEQFDVYSTWGKEGSVMNLDIDPFNHPAWKEERGTVTNVKNDVIVKFRKKHGEAFDLD